MSRFEELSIDDVAEKAFENVSVQYPMPTDGDSIYSKDINIIESDNGDFSGTVMDYFDSLLTVNDNVTATNPKEILIWFERTAQTSAIGFGCDDLGKDFSNITIELLGSGKVVRQTVGDAGDSTKRNSQVINFTPQALNGVTIKFNTADSVSLSNIIIFKSENNNSRLQAIKPDGILTDIGASTSGNLKITDAENGLAIASGEVEGRTYVHKFGNAPDFDFADGNVTVWDGANDAGIDQMVYQYSTSNDIDTLSSSNNGDTQDIIIYGLYDDGAGNWLPHTQTIALTGQAQAALTQPLIRVFRKINVGSVDLAGDVYCYVNGTATLGVPDTPADVRSIILIGNNRTLMALYTVPSAVTGYMRDWFASIAGAKKTSNYVINIFARPSGQVFQIRHKSAIAEAGSSQVQHKYTEPEDFPEKTDIEMRVSATEATVTLASISAGFDMVLIDD